MTHYTRASARRADRAFIEPLERRQLCSAGDPDSSFGVGGVVSDFTARHFAYDAIGLPDDKILVGGQMDPGDAPASHYLLRRYNADGSADVDFSQGGSAHGQLVPGNYTSIDELVAAPGGKVVARITHTPPAAEDDLYALARFNADGSRDMAFGGDAGFVPLPVGESSPGGVVVQDDGKVLVTDGHVVYRYNADGSIDEAFADAGTLALPTPTGRFISEVCPLPANGGIVIGGVAFDAPAAPGRQSFYLAKFDDSGAALTSFGDGGELVFNPGGPASGENASIDDVIVLDDGRLLACGGTDAGVAVIRLSADGVLDATFGDAGIARDPYGVNAGEILRDDQGRIYVAHRHAAIRFTAGGAVDESFGRVFGMGSPWNDYFIAGGVMLQGGGDRLVVAGGQDTYDASGIALVGRLTEDDGESSPIALDSGVMSVDGTDGADLVHADDFDDDVVSVTLNGFGRAFRSSDVNLLRVDAGGGDDVVDLSNVARIPCLVNGGDGGDRIAGSRGRDTLNGNAGHDWIDGQSGADLLNGNGGRDHLAGMGGHDRLRGGAGSDVARGGSGNDRLDGGSGIDLLHGDGGDDLFSLNADGAADSLFGDEGTDRMTGAADDDDQEDGVELA